jgi:CDP-paratose 2-epimerase
MGGFMAVALVTGAAGLIGAEAVRRFAREGLDVVGIDNDMRAYFFGGGASTRWSAERLLAEVRGYRHIPADIRDVAALEGIFTEYGRRIQIVIHTAAQPSHDWAAREPLTDFGVNALGTMNLLELTRRHSPEAPFIFTSTNKVYGDLPNQLPLIETPTRWSVSPTHPYALHGIDEQMPIDQSTHSVFGASKVAADIMVQEYGRYFGLKTVCFRGGCLTGSGHSGAELHGFLAYLTKCALAGHPYTVFGYKGKQVRDNLHSSDLVGAFWAFFQAPRAAAVYNIGGGPSCNISMVEAIATLEQRTGRKMLITFDDTNRIGDHIWYVSDIRRFQVDYPNWRMAYNADRIFDEMLDGLTTR